MALSAAISATGRSLERFLDRCFEDEQPVPGKSTHAVLVRTEDFKDKASGTTTGSLGTPALSLFLYKVNFNHTMRASWSAVGHRQGRAHLPLDLHFLLTPWAGNAYDEMSVLGRAMLCLEVTPNLSGPLLYPRGGWAENEAVQISLEEMSTEDVMRTFDSLPVDYKLSVPYVVRVVRIEEEARPPVPAVTVAAGVRLGVDG